MDIMESIKFHRDEFINDNKQFIYTTAYNVCKRKLEWENDDELSISIIAFNKACDIYDESKGSFFSFARVIIRNSLIDYFRKKSNNMLLFFGDDEENQEQLYVKNSISNYEMEIDNKALAEEIREFTLEIESYKLNLEKIIDSAPTHSDTKNNLLNIAFKCSGEKAVTEYIHKYKMLPVKQIALLTQSKIKLIERWRKYLLVLILIFTNENYIYIKSYLDIKAGVQYGNENRNSNEN
ncbi:MAG: sigma factor [Solirubrobacterales bacterium]